jgi:isocitrate/isopropylmalate dehydrogenase
MTKTFKIAAIPGDGIGNEVCPEGMRVVEAAARKHGLTWSSSSSTGPAATTTWPTAR